MDQTVPKRQLSFWHTTALILGVVIGSGIFINLPIVAKIGLSPGISVLIWLLGGLVWIPQILILAEMSTAYPEQGGPYAFLHKAGSPFLGFLYTWTAFLTSDTPTLTIIGLTAASVMTFFFPMLEIPLYAKLFAVFLIVIITIIQYRSVKLGSNIQLVLTAAKLLPLLLVVLAGFFFLDSGNLFLLPESMSGDIEGNSIFYILTAGISSTIWAYAGFLNILYMGGEIKNPGKILPVSLIGSLIFVMLAYTLISLFTAAIVPYDELISTSGEFINPFKYMGFLSEYAGGLFAIAAFISMIGVLNSVIMTQPRLEYATARDGLFFEIFGKLHPKYLTPHYSIFIQSGFAILLFLLGDIESLLGYFTLSYVLQNGLVYGAIFFLRKREDYSPTYKSPLWKLMAGLSIVIQLYLAYGTFIAFPVGGVLASLALILSGLPVYYYFYKVKK